MSNNILNDILNKAKVSPRDNRRKVIKVGKFTVRTLVEVYPVDIKILTYFDSSDHHENGGKYTFKHFTRYKTQYKLQPAFEFV